MIASTYHQYKCGARPCTCVRPARLCVSCRPRSHKVHAKVVTPWVAQAAVDGAPTQRSDGSETAILALTDSLRLLETERDEAVKTAESCARTAVKLEEMTRLLENLAVDKLTEGDEEGARQVLQEKAAVMEVLSRTGNRAQVNYSLAAKLAEKIGQQQLELMHLLAPTTLTNSSNAAPQPAAASTVASAASQRTERQPGGTLFAQYDASKSSAERLGSDRASLGGSGSDSAAVGSSGYEAPWEAPWEKSIAEAKERIKKAEEEAASAGRRAAWQQQESLEEARERLRSSAWASVDAARSRIRQSSQESIEQARARIAAEDAAVLAQVHTLISRYRSGAYVSEDELDWAFRQLEKRSWRQ